MSNQQSIIDAQEAQIELLEKYILLLGGELNDLAVMASIHGWKSSRIAVGEEMRDLIEKGKVLILGLK